MKKIIGNKRIKRNAIIFILIEMTLLAIIFFNSYIDKKNEEVIPLKYFQQNGYKPLTNNNVIYNSDIYGGLKVELIIPPKTIGIYEFSLYYSCDRDTDDILGAGVIGFSGDDRIFDSVDIVSGENNRLLLTAFVDDSLSNKNILVKVYSRANDLKLDRIVLRKTSNIVATSKMLILITILLWLISILFPFDIIKEGSVLKSLSLYIFILAFTLIYIGGVSVILMGAAFVLFAVSFIIDSTKKKRIEIKFLIEDHWLFAFFLIAFITGFFALHDKASAIGGSIVVIFYFIIYIFSRDVFSVKYKDKVFFAIAFSLLTASILSLAHVYIIKKPIAIGFLNSITLIYDQSNGNIASLFDVWPTRGGYKIALILSMIIPYLFSKWKNLSLLKRIIYLLSITSGLISLGLTHSRGAYIFLFIAVSFYFLLSLKWKAIKIILPFVIILGGLIFITANEKIIQTLKDPMGEINIRRRFFQNEIALDLIKEDGNWLKGIGMINFKEEILKYRGHELFEDTDFVHNIYISILLETGIFGFIALFGFFIILFIKMIKTSRTFNSRVGLGIIASFAVTGLFTSMMIYGAPISIFMWFAYGLSQNKGEA